MGIVERIAQELAVGPRQVQAAAELLDQGATVPFVARYRKEATGGLDDEQLRAIEERLGYLRELEERRMTVLNSIEGQGKLTPELKRAILEAQSKTRLEDLYLPYRPRRRTKAQVAREAGLEPLALGLLHDPRRDPEALAAGYVDPEAGVADIAAALEGARHILIERAGEDAELIGELRGYAWEHGRLQARAPEDEGDASGKFADYREFEEPIHAVPSHRALALLRGRKEGALRLKLLIPGQDDRGSSQGLGACEGAIARRLGIEAQGRAADAWLLEAVRWAWRVKIASRLETDLIARLRERAESEAIRVFGVNLRDLLLAAPAGPRPTMGLDPGLRTGVKVAVIDGTSKLVETATIYPHAPQRRWEEAITALADLARRHAVELVSIGNGTGSRETERLVADLSSRVSELGLHKVTVNEAGASVYSASAYASRELPDLDVSLRGAVSIARRLQDPLAELVKIDPKSIGVGQYQHDVGQTHLARALDNVVEDCVNAVGVDANTASAPLLSRVAGLSSAQAQAIVKWRDEHGPLRDRQQLLKVPRLGPRAFEQCAGFLRIHGGDDPLDASAVHPEAYPVVERICASTGCAVAELIGNREVLSSLRPAGFVDERFGEPTVRDILAELEKPGRDPRPELRTAVFREGIESPADLEPGMILEGVVSNVANFGAFVDIGVHQDGLVHISALSERFVRDPREVVKAGEVVRVKVTELDLERKRIGLSMRLSDDPGAEQGRNRKQKQGRGKGKARSGSGSETQRAPGGKEASRQPGDTAMAAAFDRAKGSR